MTLKPLDKQIGARLKKKRLEKGLTQSDMAAELGVSFQQVQKYENSTNRISVSRLVDVCEVLKVSYLYFIKEEKVSK